MSGSATRKSWIHGRWRFDGGDRLTARAIVIAAGAEPFVPNIPGLEEAGYLTSDTMWDALRGRDEMPRRIVIVGGGPIGTEMAQAFARLGAEVTQVENGPRILSKEDEDVSKFVEDILRAEGVAIRTGHEAIRCEGKTLIVRADGNEIPLPFDEIIVAVGRKARLGGYGLEELGIETDHTVVTNDYLETLYPNIFAAGDVAGPYQFTHFAAHQAWYAAVNALFGAFRKFRTDYSVLPWVTYTDPRLPMSDSAKRPQTSRARPTRLFATTSAISTGQSPKAPIAASSNCSSSPARTGFSARPSLRTTPARCSPNMCWR
jgi:pyruvate/2-oxoglutarate dehydrogenase complex dihydrolipoamide dehydrogenase (E3) component